MSQSSTSTTARQFGQPSPGGFAALPLREKLAVAWELFRLQASLLFSQKFLWAMLIILVYLGLRYYENYHEDVLRRITQEGVITELLALPLTILTVFLNMQLITSEKDNRTLEVMFTTAGSRYKVWLLKVTVLNVVLFLIALFLGLVSFFTFTDMAIFASALYIFIPIFFLGNLTLFFAVRFRSGLAAGMVSAGVIFLLFISNTIMEENDLYRYMLYFNPYDIPRTIDPQTWGLWTLQNKIGVFLLALLMLFFALRGMEKRERLLR